LENISHREYANIVLNLPLHQSFTYRIPEYLKDRAEAGKRVVVNFGKRTLTGVIISFSDAVNLKNIKNIKSVLDDDIILEKEIIDFCRWISEYYIAPIGEVIFSCIPRKTNITSKVYYKLKDNYKDKINDIRGGDEILFSIINLFKEDTKKKVTRKQIEKNLKTSNTDKYTDKLIKCGIIEEENLYDRQTTEKTIKTIVKNFAEKDADTIIREFNIKSDKQKSVLKEISESENAVLSDLVKRLKISQAPIVSLHNKGLIKITEVPKKIEYSNIYEEEAKAITLNEEQRVCLEKIKDATEKSEFKTFLLYGVTGSGKTEIYLNIIQKLIAEGKSVIVLVPEISLTPQLLHRFHIRFGDKIGVIHSKVSDYEKYDTFKKIRSGKYQIIIGARSALFAPVKNLGLIAVDEEHDASYKQSNAPRYNARDAAIVRAKINNAVVILGSATPSLESYYNASAGKYELLTLKERATKINLPEIKIINLSESQPSMSKALKIASKDIYTDKARKDFTASIGRISLKTLSEELVTAISDRLEKRESIIILQNLRGYHSYIECIDCGHVETCISCNICLTYHKKQDLLKCHYCGFTKSKLKNCSNCGSTKIAHKGLGTERVEEELLRIFPGVRIQRVDSDTMSSRKKYSETLKNFYDGNTDILAGTQMISKGLDFPNVTLVGVINADIGLLRPDFRATERTFQMLTQVSGRSGRSEKQGTVFIQTNHPDFEVMKLVQTHDYKNFYDKEIEIRRTTEYPPFSRLSITELRSKEPVLLESKAKELYNYLKKSDIKGILKIFPPNPPLYSKLKDFYRYHIIIKSLKVNDISGDYMIRILKSGLRYAGKYFSSKVRVTVDVDAMEVV